MFYFLLSKEIEMSFGQMVMSAIFSTLVILFSRVEANAFFFFFLEIFVIFLSCEEGKKKPFHVYLGNHGSWNCSFTGSRYRMLRRKHQNV